MLTSNCIRSSLNYTTFSECFEFIHILWKYSKFCTNIYHFLIIIRFIKYRSPSFISTISSVHWSFAVCTAHLLCNQSYQTYCTWYINLGFRSRLAQYFIVFPPRLWCIWTFRLPQAPSFGEITSCSYQHSVRIALIYPRALIRFIDRSEVEYCYFEIPLNIGTLSSLTPQNWIPRYLIMGITSWVSCFVF